MLPIPSGGCESAPTVTQLMTDLDQLCLCVPNQRVMNE